MKQVTYTTRKTILSILALVLTFIALGTTTFAWFSLSTVSKISQISGEVRGGEGLLIRLVDKNNSSNNTPWKANLSQTDVSEFLEKIRDEDMRFTAVSGTTVGTFTKMKLDTDDNRLYIDGDNAIANEDYLNFRIEFKSETAGSVALQSYELRGKSSDFSSPVAFAGPNGPILANTPFKINPANAVRFAFVDGAKIDIYQQTHENDGNVAHNDIREEGQWAFLNAMEEKLYLEGKAGTGPENSLLYADLATHNVQFLAADVEVKDTEFELTLTNGEYIGGLDITIWLEGWDVDTFDAIYNGSFELDLQFKKESPSTP